MRVCFGLRRKRWNGLADVNGVRYDLIIAGELSAASPLNPHAS